MLAILFCLFSFSFLFVGLAILVPLNYHINFRIILSVLHTHTSAGIAHKSIHELGGGGIYIVNILHLPTSGGRYSYFLLFWPSVFSTNNIFSVVILHIFTTFGVFFCYYKQYLFNILISAHCCCIEIQLTLSTILTLYPATSCYE